jgi:hypothetical protein
MSFITANKEDLLIFLDILDSLRNICNVYQENLDIAFNSSVWNTADLAIRIDISHEDFLICCSQFYKNALEAYKRMKEDKNV